MTDNPTKLNDEDMSVRMISQRPIITRAPPKRENKSEVGFPKIKKVRIILPSEITAASNGEQRYAAVSIARFDRPILKPGRGIVGIIGKTASI